MSTCQALSGGRRRLTCPADLHILSRPTPLRRSREWKIKPPAAATFTLILFAALILVAGALPLHAEKAALEEVATFPQQQVTGVTVSPEGQVFVNFPFWSDDHTCRWLRSSMESKAFP